MVGGIGSSMISVPMNRARAGRLRAAGMLALGRAGVPAAGFEGLDVVWTLTVRNGAPLAAGRASPAGLKAGVTWTCAAILRDALRSGLRPACRGRAAVTVGIAATVRNGALTAGRASPAGLKAGVDLDLRGDLAGCAPLGPAARLPWPRDRHGRDCRDGPERGAAGRRRPGRSQVLDFDYLDLRLVVRPPTSRPLGAALGAAGRPLRSAFLAGHPPPACGRVDLDDVAARVGGFGLVQRARLAS